MKSCWLFAGFWNITTHTALSTTAVQSPEMFRTAATPDPMRKPRLGFPWRTSPPGGAANASIRWRMSTQEAAELSLSCQDEVPSLNKDSVYIERKSEQMSCCPAQPGPSQSPPAPSPDPTETWGPGLPSQARPSLSQEGNGWLLEEDTGAPKLQHPRASKGCPALQHALAPGSGLHSAKVKPLEHGRPCVNQGGGRVHLALHKLTAWLLGSQTE